MRFYIKYIYIYKSKIFNKCIFHSLILGKYVSVNARGEVTARVEAMGPQEQIEVVIQEEKIALQGHNGYFLTVTDDGEIKAQSQKAKEKEIFCLRTNTSRRFFIICIPLH